MKKILLAGVLIIMSLTLASCLDDYKNECMEQAKRLLSERYHEEFVVKDYIGQQAFDSYYTVHAFSEKYPDMLFSASIEQDGSGFSDGYALKRVCKKISDTVALNMDSVDGYVYVISESMIDELCLDNADISIEEFAQEMAGNRISISVFVCTEEDSQSLYTKCEGMLKGLENLAGTVSLYVSSDEKLIEKVQEYAETNVSVRYEDFKELTESYQVFRVEFEQGKMQITKEEFIMKTGKYL